MVQRYQCYVCSEAGKESIFEVPDGFIGQAKCQECGTQFDITKDGKADEAVGKSTSTWPFFASLMVLPFAVMAYMDLYQKITNRIPKCGSVESVDVVLDIIDGNEHNPPALGFRRDSYELQYIHMTAVDGVTGARSCAASLFGRKENPDEIPNLEYASGITWTIHKLEGESGGIVVSANW